MGEPRDCKQLSGVFALLKHPLEGGAIRKLLKGLFSSGWFGFCALIRHQYVGPVELSHYISQGTLQSVAAADRGGEASSAFLNIQWQGVQANIALVGFSSGERDTFKH